jgi:hypothetical protein
MNPNLQAILDEMRQSREVAQQNQQQNIQAQQHTIQLLSDLVARLDLPPHPHNNHPHNDKPKSKE